KHHSIVSGPMGKTGKDVTVFVGNSGFPIIATEAGFVEPLVKLHDRVNPGQKVAVQRNSFGEIVAEYMSSVTGEGFALRTDWASESGNPVLFIHFEKPTREGVESYPE